MTGPLSMWPQRHVPPGGFVELVLQCSSKRLLQAYRGRHTMVLVFEGRDAHGAPMVLYYGDRVYTRRLVGTTSLPYAVRYTKVPRAELEMLQDQDVLENLISR